MSDTTTKSGGIGFSGLLAIAFIVLKLTHVIDWSWWWVLSPLWIGAAFALLVVVIALVVILRDDWSRRKRAARRAGRFI